MKHSQICVEMEINSMVARATFERDFPNYCRACEALGYVLRTEPPKSDALFAEWKMFEHTNWFRYNMIECPNCRAQNKCSRCLQGLIVDKTLRPNEDVPCIYCEWEHGKTTGDTLPYLYACRCDDVVNKVPPTAIPAVAPPVPLPATIVQNSLF